MRFVVLMSSPENRYGDTPSSYPFPARYRSFFEPLSMGEPTLAMIYEPVGKGSMRGRRAYVGWAALRGEPLRSARVGVRGEPLWVVNYVDRMIEFPNPIARDPFGEPIESWLQAIPPENRDIRTSGASVRFISEDEARRIIEMGYAGQIGGSPFDELEPEVSRGLLVAEERTRRLVTALERDARFRTSVMSAYEYRCAVSGFGIGTVPLGRATSLLDAAHIRPVAERGSDDVTNGLAMTPTLHRLFDQGLFTLVGRQERVEVVTSPFLEPTMVESPDGQFRMPLVTGLPVNVPSGVARQPRAEDLRYHARHVFKGPLSVL